MALANAGGQNTITVAAGQATALNQTITASEEAGFTSSETLHGMIQANADIVAGDLGGPLACLGGVIGMDTAGNDAGLEQQAVGFAIPVNTALRVASQIAAGRASSAVAIGYPPFLGIFVGTGSDSSPQDQAQQGQQQYGSGGSQGCSASNAGLAAPSVIAPVAASERRRTRGPAQPARPDWRDGHHRDHGQAIGSPNSARRDPGAVPSRRHDLRHLGQPGRPANDEQRPPDRLPAAATASARAEPGQPNAGRTPAEGRPPPPGVGGSPLQRPAATDAAAN